MSKANSKQTSSGVGSLAGKTLQSAQSSSLQRSLAGSALAQRGGSKQTGAVVEDKAAKALGNARSASETKTLAGSVVSQSNKAR
jgi:hypothetical protein